MSALRLAGPLALMASWSTDHDLVVWPKDGQLVSYGCLRPGMP